ncbi:peptidyl-prolyl cis-trans isomerase [Xanthomonadaceae bacterium XH05]|nr:peptidyl-prolyl cis-trans isomerase [Xanthomonadaceae bacterium XH05]
MRHASATVFAALAVAFAAGGVAGFTLARSGQGTSDNEVPARWVARIDDNYIAESAFIDEMRRRGGERPGQFQELEQKRQLLDDLVYRAVLVKAAERAGVTAQPELRRAVDQLIANRYLQDTLRQTQRELNVSDDEVRAFYDKSADEYSVPARKRVAMLKISVSPDAGEPAWNEALAKMRDARTQAQKLDAGVPHFGPLARDFSDDPASRYRGGVIGWIAEGRSDRYSHDRAVIDATRALDEPGSLSDVLRGQDGVYLVRLVESEPRQTRSFDQLAAGIRQRLMQQRLAESEQQFRQRLMREVGVEVRESVLAAISPLGPPGQIPSQPQQPPAMPKDQG